MSAQLQPVAGEILLDVPAAEYHKRELGVATNSTLRMIRERSPAHYRAWIDSADDNDTPAMAFGRACHARVLEPARYAVDYQVMPVFGDLRSVKNRAARDAWCDQHPGATFISADTAVQIEAMHAALMQHPLAAGIMREGRSEVTMRWTDPETGVTCKARADWWKPGRFFMDYKTTEDACPAAFKRSVAKYSYHQQHAHYCDGAKACGENIDNYLILAQEKEPPYVCVVYHIDAATETRGYELRQRGLEIMARCIENDTWPGYGAGITELALPPWALQD